MKYFRKADIILIVLLAVIPAFALVMNVRAAARIEEPMLVIRVDGELFGTYPLDEDAEIRIGEGNTCRIRDGQAEMIHADCPDKVCVRSAPIGASGGSIVCLPHRVSLTIENAREGEEGGGPDAVAR